MLFRLSKSLMSSCLFTRILAPPLTGGVPCLTSLFVPFFLSLLACHGGKGREKGDKKGQKRT